MEYIFITIIKNFKFKINLIINQINLITNIDKFDYNKNEI